MRMRRFCVVPWGDSDDEDAHDHHRHRHGRHGVAAVACVDLGAHAGTRRRARGRRHRRPALPRGARLAARRLPRRRRLLRPQRLPHHLAAAGRAATRPGDSSAGSTPPGATAAPGRCSWCIVAASCSPRRSVRRTRPRERAGTWSRRSSTSPTGDQILADQSYFAAFGRPPMLQHLWSLAVEEQFYLVWPLCCSALSRLARAARRPHRAPPRLPRSPRPLLMALLFAGSGSRRVARLLRHRHARDGPADRRAARLRVAAVGPRARHRARRGAVLDVVGRRRAARAARGDVDSWHDSTRALYRGGFAGRSRW